MEPRADRPAGRDSQPARLLRALCSAVVPGAGQLAAGSRRRGLILLGFFLVVTIAIVALFSRGVDAVLSWAVQPDVLLLLLMVDIVVMLVRLIAVIDAWRSPKLGTLEPPRSTRAGRVLIVGGFVVLLLLTLAPHVVAGYYTVVSRDLLTSVFAGDDGTPSTSAAPSSTGPTTPGSTTRPSAGSTSTSGNPSTTPTSGSGPGTTAAALDLRGDNRITVLLIGLDEGYGREGARADSINVATLDMDTGRVAMFGIPRNLKRCPLGPKTSEALGMTEYPEIVNGLYGEAQAYPEIAEDGGDPGAAAIQETAEAMLGMPIDYYVVVNMLGLADLVDAFGGVDIKLKQAIHITYYPLAEGEGKTSYVFNVGVNHMNGLEALAYARDRRDSNDYVRMGRQRCVLLGLLYQKSAAALTLRFPKIAAAIKKNVKTNIPLSALSDLIRIRGSIDTGNMVALGFTPPDWVIGKDDSAHFQPNIPLIMQTVEAIVTDPDAWLAVHKSYAAAGEDDCYAVGD